MQNVQVTKLMLTLSIGELRHFDHLCLGGRIYANHLKIKSDVSAIFMYLK